MTVAWMSTPTIGLYLVADGMVSPGDEVASRIAAETVSAALLQTIVIPQLQGQTDWTDIELLGYREQLTTRE